MNLKQMDNAALIAYGTQMLDMVTKKNDNESGLEAAGRLIGAGPSMIEYVCELQIRFMKSAMTREEVQRAQHMIETIKRQNIK